jgi:hypothetical protein
MCWLLKGWWWNKENMRAFILLFGEDENTITTPKAAPPESGGELNTTTLNTLAAVKTLLLIQEVFHPAVLGGKQPWRWLRLFCFCPRRFPKGRRKFYLHFTPFLFAPFFQVCLQANLEVKMSVWVS